MGRDQREGPWGGTRGRGQREAAMVTPLWFQASSPVCINVLFVLHFVIFSTKKLQQRRNRQSKENLKDITDSSFCLCFFLRLCKQIIPWTRLCIFVVSVPDPKPTQVRIAFSIAHKMRSGDETSIIICSIFLPQHKSI